MRASSTRIDSLLLHMACSLGRRLRQAERPSAKSILLRQRAARQGGSESVDSKRNPATDKLELHNLAQRYIPLRAHHIWSYTNG